MMIFDSGFLFAPPCMSWKNDCADRNYDCAKRWEVGRRNDWRSESFMQNNQWRAATGNAQSPMIEKRLRWTTSDDDEAAQASTPTAVTLPSPSPFLFPSLPFLLPPF